MTMANKYTNDEACEEAGVEIISFDAKSIEHEAEKTEETNDAAAATTATNPFFKRLIISFGLVIAAVGVGLSGSIEYKRQRQQQENAHTSISTNRERGGKAGKSALTSSCVCGIDAVDDGKGEDFCEEDKVIECGVTFTNEKVMLSDDFFCGEMYSYTPNEERMALNAAITLIGPDASIDCQGHSVRQRTGVGFAERCLDFLWRNEGDPFEPSYERWLMKSNCEIYYQAGILLIDGAKAINCNVGNFYEGFYIINGGHVHKSEAVGNRNGVSIQDVTGSVETRVSDL